MTRLLKAEFYKLIRSRSFWLIVVSSFLLGSLLLLDTQRITADLFCASLYNTPLLYFMVIIFTAIYAGGDFGERTLQYFVAAGHKRGEILFTKTVTCQIACNVILAVPLAAHGILENVLYNDFYILHRHLLIESGVIILGILAMCMLPLCCAFIFKDMGRTLVVPMVIYFFAIFVLNSEKAQSIAVFLPMGQLRLLALNELNVSMAAAAGIDLLWIAGLYVAAYFGFHRSDLK